MERIGIFELMIIGAIVLLLFGNRVPDVFKSLGLGIREFRKAVGGGYDQEVSQQEPLQINHAPVKRTRKRARAKKTVKVQ